MKKYLFKKNKTQSSGFIALFSIILISFILVLVSVNLSFYNFSARFNILDSESKVKSKALAESCLELARLAFAFDNDFLGNDIVVDIGENNCDYFVLNTPPPYPTIIAHSVVNNAHTYLKVNVDTSTPFIQIISYKELSTYP